MHELSIANAIARGVCEELGEDAARVRVVRVDVGRLSGIVADALAFGWTFVRDGTPLADADLELTEVAVTIRCRPCGDVPREVGEEGFLCATCGTPSGEFLTGRELLVRAVTLADPEVART